MMMIYRPLRFGSKYLIISLSLIIFHGCFRGVLSPLGVVPCGPPPPPPPLPPVPAVLDRCCCAIASKTCLGVMGGP
jgi:hypothetical protein